MTVISRLRKGAGPLLRSPRLAAVLLTLFTLACLLGNFVPQENTAGRDAVAAWQQARPGAARIVAAVDGHRIYTSTWFLVLAGLLTLNTLACTVDQFLRARRFRAPAQAPLGGPPSVITSGTPQEVCRLLISSAPFAGLSRAIQDDDRGSILLRGYTHTGRWGSVILHVALVLVFVVIALGALTSWSASLVLTEGQSFDPRRETLHGLTAARLASPADSARLPVIRLERHYPRYRQQGYNPDSASKLVLITGSQRQTAVLRYGRPLRASGLTIRQMRSYGAAARVTYLPASAGVSPARSIDQRAVPVGLTRDYGNGGFTVSLPFTNQSDGTVQTREVAVPSLPSAVVLHLEPRPLAPDLTRSLGERFALVLDGPVTATLTVGTRAQVPGGEIRFDSLDYWTVLSVGNAPLTFWFFVAGWLVALGAALGLIWPARRVDFDLRPGPQPGLCEIRYRVPAARGAAVFATRIDETLQALSSPLNDSTVN